MSFFISSQLSILDPYQPSTAYRDDNRGCYGEGHILISMIYKYLFLLIFVYIHLVCIFLARYVAINQ